MHARSRHHRYSFEDYFAIDEFANVKLEYLDGEIYAMAGGSREHVALASALTVAFGVQMQGRPCQPHGSDLRVLAAGLLTYPDVSVLCGHVELDPQDPKHQTVTNPTVICEVLSPSTEDYDRGEKLEHYQQIPSLRHVLLVAYDQRHVEVWSRDERSAWQVESASAGGRIDLAEVGVELDVDALYRDPLSPERDLTRP